MFTRPVDVDDSALAEVLLDGWGWLPSSLDYLAVGFGSHHWRVTGAATAWFVTVDDLVAKRRESDEPITQARHRLVAALATAASLRHAGCDFVVAPVQTIDGEIARSLGDRYVVAVYPLVAGQTHPYGNFSDLAHRDAVVNNLAVLHRSPEHCRRHALTETFAIARRTDLFDCYPQLSDRWMCGPFAEPARRLLLQHAEAVARTFDAYDALVTRAIALPQRFVLTHGEPHPANTITTERGVVLVDWDTALIAPPERDLWDIVGVEPSVAARYESLSGIRLDHHTLELYRLAWDLSEIAIYVSDFRRPHERTEDMTGAWHNLQQYLDPARW
jgi:spectinomycin phosphotransferase/16S rRNA (guanine(1405)-N(7))-methyltransferase